MILSVPQTCQFHRQFLYIESNEYKCDLCDFKSLLQANINEHMTQKHEPTESHVTPPQKKMKRDKNSGEEEPVDMEVDDTEDLVNSLCMMGIDVKKKEVEEQKKRSDLMDEKVLQKQKRIEQEEAEYRERKIDEEEKKRKR